MIARAKREGQVIALTGATGSLANDLISGLAGRGHQIVAVDDRLAPDRDEVTRSITCSITDSETLGEALAGCDAVVHLAGIPLETAWSDLLASNVDGTQTVLETARLCGVSRVVLASSIHATGFVPVPPEGELVPDDVPARPDTFYGASKAMLEALGALYHDRHGLDVVCLRIASRFAEPLNERMLRTWLSPADAVRLVHAALTCDAPGYRLVWGVSANSAGYLSPDGGRAIGYHPRDDAARHTAQLAERVASDPGLALTEWDRRFLGGSFCSPEPPQFVPYAERE